MPLAGRNSMKFCRPGWGAARVSNSDMLKIFLFLRSNSKHMSIHYRHIINHYGDVTKVYNEMESFYIGNNLK